MYKATLFALLLVRFFIEAAAADPAPYEPAIPRTWADDAVSGFELPLAQPEFSPVHVSEAYYYGLAVRPIWKSYPVYRPDREPAGYRERLATLEPEPAFDDTRLHSEADWIGAGAAVFRAPIAYDGPTIRPAEVLDSRWYDANGIGTTRDGVFPYARWVIREKGKLELGILACSMCHTRLMSDGSTIEGAQGNFPLDRIIASRIRSGVVPLRLVRALSRELTDAPWVRPSPVPNMTADALADARANIPAGVLTRQGAAFDAPAKVPDLIGVRDRKYLDASGRVVHRGIGDLMRYAAANQGMDMLARFGDFVPDRSAKGAEVPPAGTGMFPGAASRYSDAQLFALAKFLYSLSPPANPNPFDARAARGRQVFTAQGCPDCHTPPLYTNNKLVPAPGFEPPDDHYERYDISTRRVGTDPALTMNTRRGTGYYKVPSLKGVWYRGPLEHSGSVSTLEDWFDPDRLRDDYVPSGFSPAGMPRRAVPGHPFGLGLSDEDKAALIAFLRTL